MDENVQTEAGREEKAGRLLLQSSYGNATINKNLTRCALSIRDPVTLLNYEFQSDLQEPLSYTESLSTSFQTDDQGCVKAERSRHRITV